MKKISVLLLIAFVTFMGCSTEDNPLEPTYDSGRLMRAFANSDILEESITEEPSGRPVYVYEPFGYDEGDVDSYEVYIDSTQPGGYHYDTTYINYIVTGAEYPTLYLLHGYGGNYSYYQDLFLIKDILDEMIATGEIIPMLVITPDNNTIFGGSFYTNSPEITTLDSNLNPFAASFGGRFEDFMVTDLIDYINERFNADTSPEKRGISGHSMGGYGAMKLAMKYPDLYGSVSSMSAPLAFDSLYTLIMGMYLENGLAYGGTDTAGFYSISPSASRPVTSMMFAMGAAFTPHEHLSPDTTYFHRISDVQLWVGIDLPFNVSGQIVDTSAVWQAWLENDPYTMLTTGNYNEAFDNIPIYLDCGSEDDLYLQLHALAFNQALTAEGISHTFAIYNGYDGDPGNPAGHSNFIAERIREILRFHSDAFQQAE